MKIKKNNLYIGIALVCMMMPASLKGSLFGTLTTVLALLVCIITILQEFGRVHMCPTMIFVIGLTSLELISTIYNGGNAFVWIKYIITYIAMYFLIMGELAKNENDFLNVGIFVFEMYIWIEIISIILGKDFLGNYNQVYMIFPCFSVVVLLLKNRTGKKKYIRKFWTISICVILGCFLSQIRYGTYDLEATFLISACLLILYVVFSAFFEKISMKFCLISIFFLNITLVVTQALLNNRLVEYIIQNILHKNLNLTGRTDLWKMSVHTILQKPLLGYGVSWDGLNIWGGKFVPHNQFLYLACIGGLLLIMCMVCWLAYIACESDRYSKKDIAYRICQYALVAQLVLFLTLSYSVEQFIPFLFVVDVASFYVEREIRNSRTKSNNEIYMLGRK